MELIYYHNTYNKIITLEQAAVLKETGGKKRIYMTLLRNNALSDPCLIQYKNPKEFLAAYNLIFIGEV